MNADEIQALRQEHRTVELQKDGTPMCNGCDENPPCATIRLLDENAALTRQAGELRKLLDSAELLEALADLEHERWSGWEIYRNRPEKTEEDERRWAWQREAPYSDLPEKMRESDRVEARKTVAVLQLHLAFLTPTEGTRQP